MQKILLSLSLCAMVAYSAVNYPYPQRKNYGNGTINAQNSSADADLKNKFQSYITNFYDGTGTCNGTPCARIKFYDPNETQANNGRDWTVSEGIGYAMLLAVYFSDKTTSYQDHFDKLWAYYKANRNSNGVMNWKIQGWNNAVGQNGATDAEFDVALALAMARYQFGDTKYETEARSLVGVIWDKEMDANSGLHKPGDAWDGNKNPSYVAPAAFEIFKDLGNSANWQKAITANYNLLKSNQNANTAGLPSGWSDASGTPNTCTNNCGITTIAYDQDAVRAPWRWAKANAWFGHADAKTLLNKLGPWVNNQNIANVKGPIALPNVTMGSNSNSSYLGSLMCALTNNASHQAKLNSFFSTMMGQTGTADASYFNQSMLLLTGLLVSGNMPNLKACAAGNCGTDMPAVANPGDGNSTILDRLSVAENDTEDNRSLSGLWEAWYAYTDVNADDKKGGKAQSTISNEKFTAKDENDNCKEIQSYRVVLKGTGTDTDWAVRIPSYTLNKGTYEYEPFVALGLDARKNKPNIAGNYTLSSCTGGFSYQYRGSAHKFKVLSSAIPEGTGSDHYKSITTASTSAWTTVTIPPGELAQPTWVEAADATPFSLANIRGWAWELVGSSTAGGTGLSANTGSLAIKDFRCLGKMTLPDYTPPKCGASTPPAAGSSSSGSNSGGGSSSSSEDGGDPDPVISVSHKVASNGAFAIKNGVNLQVSQKASMEVFGLNGKSVRKMSFSRGSYYVSLGDLPKGLYIVMVKFDNRKEILRIPVK